MDQGSRLPAAALFRGMHTTPAFDPDLLRRYGQFRPRYTSYPTAREFHDSNLGRATPWMQRYRWPIMFFTAVAFGFVAAAIAGFLLTAVPSWTDGRGFAGAPYTYSRCSSHDSGDSFARNPFVDNRLSCAGACFSQGAPSSVRHTRAARFNTLDTTPIALLIDFGAKLRPSRGPQTD